MESQEYFTSTPEQFKDSDWTPNSTIGMGNQLLGPVTPVAGSITSTTASKVITSVFNNSKYLINNSGKVYDDLTLGTIDQINKVAPNLTNKYILDPYNSLKIIGGIEITNDVLNESSPIPGTVKGTIGSTMYNVGKEIKSLIENDNDEK